MVRIDFFQNHFKKEHTLAEDTRKEGSYININKNISKVLDKKKEDIFPVLFPVAYVHESDFNTYSEANRYQKVLQELLNLKYIINKNTDQKESIITDFLLKKGFSSNLIDKANIEKFEDFILSDTIHVDPNYSLRDNILIVLDEYTSNDKLSHTKSSINIMQNSLTCGFKAKNEDIKLSKAVRSRVSIPDYLKHTKIGKSSNLFGWTDKETKTFSIKQQEEREREMILKMYKCSPHIEVTSLSNTSSSSTNNKFVNDLSNKLKSLNIIDDQVQVIHNNEEYFDKKRLYQKSIKSIPTYPVDDIQDFSKFSTRTKFYRKKKLLEYVMMEDVKYNNYYTEGFRLLDEDAKMRMNLLRKGISNKKKNTLPKFM